MTKTMSFLFLMVCVSAFSSCSTKVDLYGDYRDIPIIYGLIDSKADTNFIKITRAFCGTNDNPVDATEAALISDSSNYPGKLDAYIVELQSIGGQPYQATGRQLVLDTLTIHNKQTGDFYAPDQKLYYTTEPFKTKNGSNRYRYQLVVIKPDGDTVTSTTAPIGGDLGIYSHSVSFQLAHSDASEDLFFRPSEEAELYEIRMTFYYREQHLGQAVTRKSVSWSYGARPLSEYRKVGETVYIMTYGVNKMFNELKKAIGGDTIWNVNHPNVTRYVDDFVISMSAAGREFNEYYQMSTVLEGGNTTMTTAFSNINGGFGLFSSRINISQVATLSAMTRRDIFSKQSWGFKEE